MRAEAAYAELLRRVREKAVLAGCAELLAWDEATYLPKNAGEHRAAQLALLAGLTHDRGTDPRLGELLAAVEGSELVSDPESGAAAHLPARRGL
jgi:carboxypeptidase Taq